MITRVGKWLVDPCDVYVGRPSVWANPYTRIGTRSAYPVVYVADPIRAYEEYLLANPELLARLPELKGKVLGCFCVRLHEPRPKPGKERCHAQVLARLADAT